MAPTAKNFILVSFAFLSFLLIPVSDCETGNVADYFVVEKGNMPLILCAPHGGTEEPPGIAERRSGLLQPDVNTDLVALALSKEIQKMTGKSPYLIVAKIRRDDIDFNRYTVRVHSGPRTAAVLIEIPETYRTVRRLRDAFVKDLAEATVIFVITYFVCGTPDGR